MSPSALRHWEREGKIAPAKRTPKGTRLYSPQELLGVNDLSLPPVAYARVSSRDQKEDLERQPAVLEAFCNKNGWQTEIIKDLGSGMNYKKKGLLQLLDIEELTRDVMEIMTVFCAKLDRRRLHKSKKLTQDIARIVKDEKAESELSFGMLKDT